MSPTSRRRYVRFRPASPAEVIRSAIEDGFGDAPSFFGGAVRKRKRNEEADAILRRAFEGGFFERFVEVWRRSVRDEIRAAARELLGPLAERVKVRLECRGPDAYRDLPDMPPGDWEKAQNMRLSAVVAWEKEEG